MIRSDVRVWLATSPLDMRKGFDTLAEAVRTVLELDPLSGHLFVFRSRDAHRVKILWWDHTGYCIYCKRLERGTLVFPASTPFDLDISGSSGRREGGEAPCQAVDERACIQRSGSDPAVGW